MLKEIIFKLIPKSWYVAYVNRKNARFKDMETAKVFSEVYEKKIWDIDKEKTDDFCSGSGTTNENAARYIDFLCGFINRYAIKDIVEIGCGDFRIMKQVTDKVALHSYTGTDIVPKLILRNQENFTGDKVRFVCLNAATDTLPDGECLIIRQVLQHLNNAQIKSILDKIKKFKYVLITEHVPVDRSNPNKDKTQGPETRLNVNSGVFIELPPFNIKNIETVFEYREDYVFMNRNIEAMLRSSLIKNL